MTIKWILGPHPPSKTKTKTKKTVTKQNNNKNNGWGALNLILRQNQEETNNCLTYEHLHKMSLILRQRLPPSR